MKIRNFLFCMFGILLFVQLNGFAQTNFNVENYKAYLKSHQNMQTSALLQSYNAGQFSLGVKKDFSSAKYLDTISTKFKLTDYEKSLVKKHGFMVTERLKYQNFNAAFQDVYNKDLPVYISTDAILHASNYYDDNILKQIENEVLIGKVKDLLNTLHSNQQLLDNKYKNNPEMSKYLKDVDVYLTVPRKLLNSSATPYYADNALYVDSLLDFIDKGELSNLKLFTGYKMLFDFSQFKVRGHYTDNRYPDLAKYFKAMMWLGRVEIRVIQPTSLDTPQDPRFKFNENKRGVINSLLIRELINQTNSASTIKEIEDLLAFFVGEQDNITISNLDYLVTGTNITSANEMLDSLKQVKFIELLSNSAFAYQKILSQCLAGSDVDSVGNMAASSFMLFGQRFIIDSYVTGSVVYNKIKFNGQNIARMLPSTLDILFALGNDASAQLLKPQLDKYHYSTNLLALRYLIDSYKDEFWNSTIYNMWLNAIRKNNAPYDRTDLPEFMQTAAFWQKMMNTQLAAWSELRHDNLLYAKQSYTGIAGCSYPYSYIEPIPDFYSSMKLLVKNMYNKFSASNFTGTYTKQTILTYLNKFSNTMDTLKSIAVKELSNTELQPTEKLFLKQMMNYYPMCGVGYYGWFKDLFYEEQGYSSLEKFVVADVHTAPSDEGGNLVGWVLHGGVGPVNLGVFVAKSYNNQDIAYIGPVMSYKEVVTTNFNRLTDDDWTSSYFNSSLRPTFCNLYLADTIGNTRGEGNNLLMKLDGINEKNNVKVGTYLVAENYPNPFNPETIISFSIPLSLSESKVELTVYNLQGQIIKKLINTNLTSGSYMTKWNGTNDNGMTVPSGIYFYKLRSGSQSLTKKMMLLK